MKLIVAGTRTYTDYDEVRNWINKVRDRFEDYDSQYSGDQIISGGARGADALGEEYALHHGLHLVKFPADWEHLGKRAGFVRNEQMAAYGDVLLTFWDGTSRGTAHMLQCMREVKKPWVVVGVYP